MRDCMDVDKVVARLRRIEGQVRGLIGMVQKDIPCEDILVQISAAKAALHKTGQTILEGHLGNCVLAGIASGEADKTLKKLARAIEQFSRMT
ncbi:MAG: metal-sensing transcriptional repressor [Deltaproteobacteria bacterium]|nr:metal-sensing transcriptional repressor [Deltaproteobacteria bacterium]